MKIPVIRGLIDRRMLVNFTVDLDVAKAMVPAPFTPKAFQGKAIAGICLIRLKNVRPKGLPGFLGISSENGAHRIAVEWEEDGQLKEGVYIPRRDTSSKLNAWAGGRIFPGRHYQAKFDVKEDAGHYHLTFNSSDGAMISIDAMVTDALGPQSVFEDLSTASAFFKTGAAGYSSNGNKFDGLYLNTYQWEMRPMEVSYVQSSYFENENLFPKGTVQFDNALLMTNIEHEWSSIPDKC